MCQGGCLYPPAPKAGKHRLKIFKESLYAGKEFHSRLNGWSRKMLFFSFIHK